MDSLVEQRLLDDVRFAEMYVADKRTLEAWGSERIRRGLRERGIVRELAERALGVPADGEEPASELERALELLRRRFPGPPARPPPARPRTRSARAQGL